jgi:hypothetical protein
LRNLPNPNCCSFAKSSMIFFEPIVESVQASYKITLLFEHPHGKSEGTNG